MTHNQNVAIEFHDTWGGWTPVHVVSFATKVRGARVKRFRFQTIEGRSIGTFASSFSSVEAAIAAASRYPAIFRIAA